MPKLHTTALFTVLSVALPLAQASPYDTPHRGSAMYHEPFSMGACSLPQDGRPTVAVGVKDYAGARACGACIEVTNLANRRRVEVLVTDECPTCEAHELDLSSDAFAEIADTAIGRIDTRWRYVACTPTTLSLNFRDISSIWWTEIQVRDHRYPVARLSWRTSGSGKPYVPLPRQGYNYFRADTGMGVGPFDIKMTDVHGQTVIAKRVPLTMGVDIATKVQFPVLPGATAAGRSLLSDLLSLPATP